MKGKKHHVPLSRTLLDLLAHSAESRSVDALLSRSCDGSPPLSPGLTAAALAGAVISDDIGAVEQRQLAQRQSILAKQLEGEFCEQLCRALIVGGAVRVYFDSEDGRFKIEQLCDGRRLYRDRK